MAYRNRIECYICEVPYEPRSTSRIYGDENINKREVAIYFRSNLNFPPIEFNENSRVCFNCVNMINTEVRTENDPSYTRLNVLRSVRNGSCLICFANENVPRLTMSCRVNIYLNKNIFVPDSTRCCPHHLDDHGNLSRALHPGLQYFDRSYKLAGIELKTFLSTIHEVFSFQKRDLTDENSYSDEEFQLISPVTKQQFEDILNYCDPVPQANGLRYVKKKMFSCFYASLSRVYLMTF